MWTRCQHTNIVKVPHIMAVSERITPGKYALADWFLIKYDDGPVDIPCESQGKANKARTYLGSPEKPLDKVEWDRSRFFRLHKIFSKHRFHRLRRFHDVVVGHLVHQGKSNGSSQATKPGVVCIQ